MTNATPFLTEIASSIATKATSERERAVLIHDFVRDRVRYGFTPRFDDATPGETLKEGVGHCNPQTRLFVELLRAVGIEARYHFVTLGGEILRGVLPNAPARISHSFAEVRLDGRWLKVDSYIVDPEHAAGAAARLAREGRELGYGFHIRGRVTWDGASDSFSQYADSSMNIEDHGTWNSQEEFFATSAYQHKVGPVTFSMMLGAMPRVLFGAWWSWIDGRMDRIRNEAGPSGAVASMPARETFPALQAA